MFGARLPAMMISLVGLAACGGDEATAPAAAVTVSITGPSQVNSAVMNNLRRCDYPLTATASGGGAGDEITWAGLTLEWKSPTSGQTIGSTIQLTATELAAPEWFGSQRLPVGQSRLANRFTWLEPHHPFQQVHTFGFQLPNGEVQQAVYTLTCL